MKSIYEYFNKIETDLDEYNQEILSEQERQCIKKRLKKKLKSGSRRKKAIAAACAVICLTALAAGPFEVQVKAAVESLNDALKYVLWNHKDVEAYETVVHTTQKNRDISVELEAVILDDREMIVATNQTYPEKIRPEKIQRWIFGEYKSMDDVKKDVKKSGLDNGHPMLLGDMYIDGKRVNSSTTVDTFQTADKKARVIYSFNMKNDEEIPDIKKKNEIQIDFQQITGDTKGKWSFSFEADGKDLHSDTVSVPINQSYVLPDGKRLTLTEYKYNALGPKIYYKLPEGRNEYLMQLRGTDDQGRSMIFHDAGAGEDNNGKFDIIGTSFSIRADDAKTMTLDLYIQQIVDGKEPSQALNAYRPCGQKLTIQTQR